MRILLLLAAAAMSSCSFVQRVDRTCWVSVSEDLKPSSVCECRDLEAGRFVRCP